MAKSRRKDFREMSQAKIGLVGLMLVAVVLATAFNVGKIRTAIFDSKYTADFSEAGGLRSGDDVRVAGLKVGEVTGIHLQGDHVQVSFSVSGVVLGTATRASVKSDNALGSKFLGLEPRGGGDLDNIPQAQTDPGFAVNEELGRLTSSVGEIDEAQLARSFDSVSAVLSQTPTEFRSALRGVSALSATVTKRDAELKSLLNRASNISEVLASRNEDITSILHSGSLLFAEFEARRQVLSRLLSNVRKATAQLNGLTKDNRKSLRPALVELKHTAELLTEYRGTLDYAVKNFGVYVRALGETVGSGPFFQAYVSNLTSPEELIVGGVPGIIKQVGTP